MKIISFILSSKSANTLIFHASYITGVSFAEKTDRDGWLVDVCHHCHLCPLEKGFSNLKELSLLLKCRFCFRRSGESSRVSGPHRLPGDVNPGHHTGSVEPPDAHSHADPSESPGGLVKTQTGRAPPERF